jgi:hypothetical protein
MALWGIRIRNRAKFSHILRNVAKIPDNVKHACRLISKFRDTKFGKNMTACLKIVSILNGINLTFLYTSMNSRNETNKNKILLNCCKI